MLSCVLASITYSLLTVAPMPGYPGHTYAIAYVVVPLGTVNDNVPPEAEAVAHLPVPVCTATANGATPANVTATGVPVGGGTLDVDPPPHPHMPAVMATSPT